MKKELTSNDGHGLDLNGRSVLWKRLTEDQEVKEIKSLNIEGGLSLKQLQLNYYNRYVYNIALIIWLKRK